MATIDAHAHLWDRRRFDYAWLDQEPALPAVFLPGDLTTSGEASADRYVFVQAGCRRDQGVAEAAWVQTLDGPTQRLAGIVAFAPLEDADCESTLDALADVGSVVGVRRLLQDEPDEFFADAGLGRGLDALDRRGWTFDACVRWPQLGALSQLARSHDGLPIVLDHLGKPPIGSSDESAFARWRILLELFAELPNCAVKLSGLPAELGTSAGESAYGPWLRAAFDRFGPERAMIGTDWPVSGGAGISRDDWFRVVKDATGASGSEWAAISMTTAARFYSLPSLT